MGPEKFLERVDLLGRARELFADDEAGRPQFAELRRENAGGQLEQVGSELRALAGKEGLLGADVHGVG